MLDITCDDCGRVLISPRRITRLTATDQGLRVDYVCWCGLPGSEVTGRLSSRAVPEVREERKVMA